MGGFKDTPAPLPHSKYWDGSTPSLPPQPPFPTFLSLCNSSGIAHLQKGDMSHVHLFNIVTFWRRPLLKSFLSSVMTFHVNKCWIQSSKVSHLTYYTILWSVSNKLQLCTAALFLYQQNFNQIIYMQTCASRTEQSNKHLPFLLFTHLPLSVFSLYLQLSVLKWSKYSEWCFEHR